MSEEIESTEELEPIEVEALEDTPPPLSPREEKLEELSAVIEAEDNGTIVDNLGNEISDEDYDEEDPEPPIVAPESPVFLNSEGEYAMSLTVNGQEVVRTVKDITADSQKHMSADQRLERIAGQQKDFNAREADLLQREAMFNEHAAAQANNQLSSQDAGDDALESAKALLEQIYDGNSDDAAVQLAQLIAGRQQPTLDTDAIGRQATKDAIAQIGVMNAEKAYTDSIGKGADWVDEHHPEIRASKSLTRFVDSEINAIMASEPSTLPEDAIKQATEVVLEQMGRPTTDTSSRQINKAGLHREPAKKSLSRKRPTPEVIDNSPQAVIAAMRKERQILTGRASN